MPNHTLIYEQPLNERMRTFLRLEYLFLQIQQYFHGASMWDSRITLMTILEILSIVERSDLKSELIKELEKHIHNLLRFEQQPNVNTGKLTELLAELKGYTEQLQNSPLKLGHGLKSNELVMSFRQRLSIPGGTCNFDLPAFHYWLAEPANKRIDALREWSSEFKIVEAAVNLIIRLTREAGSQNETVAENGFFQHTLDPNQRYQIARVAIAPDYKVFPEISGGKHRINIRFLTPGKSERPQQAVERIPFTLICCVA